MRNARWVRNCPGNLRVMSDPKTINMEKPCLPFTENRKRDGIFMKTAIYPGSFDPVTTGHLNIIRRASRIFDKLIVCVMVNGGKQPMFSLEERVELIKMVTEDLPNVTVDGSDALLAEYAKTIGDCVIVKGLRAGSDFEYEFQMAMINHKINPELDTLFLTAEQQYTYLSSSMVKELGSYHVDLHDFLPERIIPVVERRIQNIQGGNRT